MLEGILKNMRKGERGITGLETAIILIAFVVVAAVFAYTTLSAGLFATQKSSEAVYSGLKSTQATLELRGGVIATANTSGSSGTIKQISFTVSNVLGGEGIDFTAPTADSDNTGLAADGSSNMVTISYVDADQQYNDLYWTLTKLGNADDDNLLESNEKFEVTIGSTTENEDGGNLCDVLATDLTTKKTFDIEILTPFGAVLTIERTTPAYIDNIINLH
ncbi:archaellin/type IV pilin N-terminal domain-containing protein [Chloroflexota bacterium]